MASTKHQTEREDRSRLRILVSATSARPEWTGFKALPYWLPLEGSSTRRARGWIGPYGVGSRK